MTEQDRLPLFWHCLIQGYGWATGVGLFLILGWVLRGVTTGGWSFD